MSKNLIIDGKTYEGVTALKAKDADSGLMLSFPDTSDATATASDIAAGKSAYVAGEKIDGTSTGTTPNNLDGLVDGSITSFTMPSGMAKIAQYRFYQMTNLLSANLGGASNIEQCAFDGCTALTGLSLPATITNVGAYAFRNVSTGGTAFVFSPSSECVVDTYGFNGSKVSKVSGKFGSIGTYAFASCLSLNEIDIEATDLMSSSFSGCTAVTTVKAKINGAVGNYSFYGLTSVSNCVINKTSDISSVGDYAFSQFGSNRASASSNILTLDFRNSSFTVISQYAFGGDSSTASLRNKYMNIMFPDSVEAINAYAFRYTDYCNFFFNGEKPLTLSVTTAWSNATNYRIFVPYNSVHAYRTATNWASHSTYIRGYASENTFGVGDSLPLYGREGYGFTWYKDVACTIPAATVEADTAYYCVVGTERIAYGIVGVNTIDCDLLITDGSKNYSLGDGVLIGTELTITAVPSVEGYIPFLFTVNGENFDSGDTFEMDEDLVIIALYYNGVDVPINPTFSANPWSIIYTAFREGFATSFWSVGDTKQVTLTNGATMTVRIADMQTGRYALLDSSGSSNGVLEFVECFANSGQMNTTNTNAGGWANSYMRNTNMLALYALLPADLQLAISEVVVLSGTGSGTTSGISSSNNKLFLPCSWEIFGTASGSIGSIEGTPQFDYYLSNNTNAARIKYRAGSASAWWLRSPYSGGSNSFCGVTSGGDANYGSASYTRGVAPCFAI